MYNYQSSGALGALCDAIVDGWLLQELVSAADVAGGCPIGMTGMYHSTSFWDDFDICKAEWPGNMTDALVLNDLGTSIREDASAVNQRGRRLLDLRRLARCHKSAR